MWWCLEPEPKNSLAWPGRGTQQLIYCRARRLVIRLRARLNPQRYSAISMYRQCPCVSGHCIQGKCWVFRLNWKSPLHFNRAKTPNFGDTDWIEPELKTSGEKQNICIITRQPSSSTPAIVPDLLAGPCSCSESLRGKPIYLYLTIQSQHQDFMTKLIISCFFLFFLPVYYNPACIMCPRNNSWGFGCWKCIYSSVSTWCHAPKDTVRDWIVFLKYH